MGGIPGIPKFVDPGASLIQAAVTPKPKAPVQAAAPQTPTAPPTGDKTQQGLGDESTTNNAALGSITSGQASTILTSPLGQTGPEKDEDLARKALLGG